MGDPKRDTTISLNFDMLARVTNRFTYLTHKQPFIFQMRLRGARRRKWAKVV